jgi:hypothetical protein
MTLFTRVSWFFGIYPGDPHNNEAFMLYVVTALVVLVLLCFWGFWGSKTFRERMKRFNRKLTYDSALWPVDVHQPLGSAFRQTEESPSFKVRFGRWIRLNIFWLVVSSMFLIILYLVRRF